MYFGLSRRWGFMVLCTLWSAKFVQRLNIKINFWFQNGIYYKNMSIKIKVTNLWKRWKKGNDILAMIVSITKIKLHMFLKGNNLFYNRFLMGVDNLIQVLIQVLMHQRGLTKYLIGIKLMTFGANGVFCFSRD